MSLTKEQIDALVDGMPRDEEHRCWVDVSGYRLIADEFRAILYLAAGLTAEGERKPERVVGTLFEDHEGRLAFRKDGEWIHAYSVPVHGTFVPDGAE